MVAAMRPTGLFHLLMISPQNEYNQYSKTFENVVSSVKFDDKYKGPVQESTTSGGAGTVNPGASNSGASNSGGSSAPEVISGAFHGSGYSFTPPQGWQASRQSDGGVTILPSNGAVGQGIARGILAGFTDAGKLNQWDALSKLIQDLTSKNPGLAEMPGYRKALNFGGASGESVFLEGDSPVQGQKEYVWLVAALKPKGLFHMLMIAPASEYASLSAIYEDVVRSVELE